MAINLITGYDINKVSEGLPKSTPHSLYYAETFSERTISTVKTSIKNAVDINSNYF